MSRQLIAGLETAASTLVIGATGGIGLALVQHLLSHPGVLHVTAAARHADQSIALAALLQAYPERLRITVADITDTSSLGLLANQLRAAPLHLAINATGLLHDDNLQPEKNLAAVSNANLQQVFAVNAFGPILLAQALLPLMRHGQPAVFASLSARVGSIGDNRLGGWYAYRAAKAAQNQFLKTAAIECRRTHPQLSIQLLHPGTVDSELSRPFQRGVAAQQLFTPDTAASQLLDVLSTATAENSGRFIAWDGNEIAW
jgi:NAD(P)-dependent dehydrogenase (short-subunit alcohol dehydrogenase family)